MPAASQPAVVVEVGSESENVQAKLVRRLVQLELTDPGVPPPVDAPELAAPLYFRVVADSEKTVRIELWQVGVHYGARTVSAGGGPQLTARRIALASAELARRLRRRREAELARAAREADQHEAGAVEPRGHTLDARTTLSAAVTGAAVGPGAFWLVGPSLRGGLRLSSGARLDLGAAVLAGSVGEPDGVDALRWLEFSLSPGYDAALTKGLFLDVGMDVAVAAVHVDGVLRLDGGEARSDTWSARATGHARLAVRAGQLLLGFGPDVGAVLRPIDGVTAAGASVDLGGLWLGGSVGVVFDPPAEPRPERH